MRFIITVILVFFTQAAIAQVKSAVTIATISLDKVYDGYWKKDQEYEKLKKKQEDNRGKIEKYNTELRKEGEALQRMVQRLSDPNLTSAEKAKRQQQVADKQRAFQQLQQSIQSAQNSARQDLELELRKVRKGIIEEIQQVVAVKAKAKGYTHVLDKSAQSAAIAPIVVFSVDGNDLTEEVLKQLNLSAPKKDGAGKK
ncbi:MAG: OmpH family outer membrane protein [Verrucomicrobiota bacterium]|jgi:Skp family chaperone for outer membrane proteins|nr:OmpH family outer membrane protein [Verrucomicrobiota bacterium]